MIGPAEIRNAGILIVDDSSVNVTLLSRMLETEGYTNVSSTTKSIEVFALHRDHRYDLILLDLMMPEMDGFEVLEGLRSLEAGSYAPVVVLTAQPAHKLRALKAGARDFITKPFDQTEVLLRIRNTLESRLLFQESRNNATFLEQYDQLTGLPNRRRFRDLLLKALARPEAATEVVSVLVFSVDRFNVVNDVLGRSVGGAMISAAADRLVSCLSPMSTLARFEEATFGVIIVSPADEPPPANGIAKQMRELMREPIHLDGHDVAATLSVGIAISPTDAREADLLLSCASRALSDAVQAGGDTFRYHSTESSARAKESLALETALRAALDRNEFEIHYQPKMRIRSGEWTSAEALLRWNRPGLGLQPPNIFIPALEESGLIIQVGYWVLDAVCAQIAAWRRDGLGELRVAVNTTATQIEHPGFVASVERAIREHRIAATSLDIEITESALMSRSAETDAALLALKTLGVTIAIDDFGTGYSSLSYLKRYPIDALKIDISFIREITTDADDAAIAIAIINMARILKMTVIAEGVETEAQLALLREHSCDEIQGYLFSKPLPAAALAAWRRSRDPAVPTA